MSIRKKFTYAVVAIMAIVLSTITTSFSGAQAISGTTINTISGDLGEGSGWSGWRVFIVSPSGRAKSTTVASDGRFSFANAKSSIYSNATLHVVTAKGLYYGPIVLKVETLGSIYCSHLKLASNNVSLGGLTKQGGATGAFIASGVSASKFKKSAVKAKSYKGVPLGAGLSGIAKVSSSNKRACNSATIGTSTLSIASELHSLAVDPDALGSDLDNDGLPNSFDADDDGDKVIDAVDPDTRVSAALNPWIDLRSDDPALNKDVNPALSYSDISQLMGNVNSFMIQFFIGQANLVPGDPIAVMNKVAYAYVECGSLVYCGGDSPTAIDTNTHNVHNNTGVPWSTYTGGFAVESNGQPATSGIDTGLGLVPDGKGNALYMMNRNGSDDPNKVYWLASIFPNQGASSLENVVPGDVYVVHFGLITDGVVTDNTIVMMLNPHPVTAPGLIKVNGADYTSGAIVPNGQGKITLEFYRPQRLTASGESGDFMDMGNLQYAMVYMPEGSNSVNCGLNSMSNFANSFSDNSGDQFWPLRDLQATDSASGAEATTLSFTVDIDRCLGAAYSSASSGDTFQFQLTGAGELLTGGSNRTSLNLTIQKP